MPTLPEVTFESNNNMELLHRRLEKWNQDRDEEDAPRLKQAQPETADKLRSERSECRLESLSEQSVSETGRDTPQTLDELPRFRTDTDLTFVDRTNTSQTQVACSVSRQPEYHSILGHREVSTGAHREYVTKTPQQVYPEYVVLYRRAFI